MTEIIDRLRKRAESLMPPTMDELYEAADEIEKLREERNRLREELRSSKEMLRSAVQSLLFAKQAISQLRHVIIDFLHDGKEMDSVAARAALKETE